MVAIEKSPEHSQAYIELFTNRFSSLLEAKDLGEATEYLPEENEGNVAATDKNDFLGHLKERAKEEPKVSAVIDDIESYLEKAI